eukprot:Rmarinus@m.21127
MWNPIHERLSRIAHQVLFLLLLFVLCGGNFHENAGFSNAYNAARSHHARGSFLEAIPFYKAALEIDETHARARMNYATALYSINRVDDAIMEMEISCTYSGEDAIPIGQLAVMLSQSGRSEEAISKFEKSLVLDPWNYNTYAGLSGALLAIGDAETALKVAQVGLDLARQRGDSTRKHLQDLYAAGAGAYGNLGELDHAIQWFSLSLSSGVTAPVLNNYANKLYDAAAVEESVVAYQHSLQLQEADAITHFNLGDRLRSLNQLSLSEVHLRRAMQLRSPYKKAASSLFATLLASGKYVEAVRLVSFLDDLSAYDPELAWADVVARVSSPRTDMRRKMQAARILYTAVSPAVSVAGLGEKASVVPEPSGGAAEGREVAARAASTSCATEKHPSQACMLTLARQWMSEMYAARPKNDRFFHQFGPSLADVLHCNQLDWLLDNKAEISEALRPACVEKGSWIPRVQPEDERGIESDEVCYEAYPFSYVLPQDTCAFVQELTRPASDVDAAGEDELRHAWAVKPTRMAEGKGVHVVEDVDDIPLGVRAGMEAVACGANGCCCEGGTCLYPTGYFNASQSPWRAREREWIAQRYVSPPSLLGGRKADLRLYVYIRSIQPFDVLFYKNGLTRIAADFYDPSRDQRHDIMAHLTNRAISKFGNVEDAWKVFTVRELAEELRAGDPRHLMDPPIEDWDAVWDDIREMLREVMLTAYEHALHTGVLNGTVCTHQLYGIDVMHDSRMRPYLIEMNNRASLGAGAVYGAEHYEAFYEEFVGDLLNAVRVDMFAEGGLPDPNMIPSGFERLLFIP